MIHIKSITGDEVWNEYDEQGRVIYMKLANDEEIWYNCYNNYYEHIKRPNGTEHWLDANNKIICYRDIYGNMH